MMNILKRYWLRKRQQALMRKYEMLERQQTENSDDMDFYRYIQHKLDALDSEAERIRGILEGRWKNDG